MSALAADLSPNFTGPARGGDLLAREVLAEEFTRHGIVSKSLEESLASQWEREHGRACVRTWEEDPENRASYDERKSLFAMAKADRPRKLIMDPQVAEDEIARLKRTGDPSVHARINELRTEVLGLDPLQFGDEGLVDPIVREAELNKAETKWHMFLAAGHQNQLALVAKETDLDFLDRALHGPRKDVTAMLRKAVKERITELTET